MPRAPHPLPPRTRWAVVFIALAGLGLGLATLASEIARRTTLTDALELASRHQALTPDLRQRLDRAPDADAARLLLAWHLLNEPTPDPGEPGETTTSASVGRRLADADRLAEARRLGRSLLARRPASWAAATVVGSSTYLERLALRDPDLVRRFRDWETPLELARRLAPRQQRPRRVLASAYLELWPMLSREKQTLARELTAEVMAQPAGFDQLVRPWLAVAGSDREALAVFPDQPSAWRRVQALLMSGGDWPGLCRAWEAERDILLAHAARTEDEIRRLLDGGESVKARTIAFDLAMDLPPDHRWARAFETVLLAAPYGPAPTPRRGALRGWLTWAVDEELRGRNALAPAAIDRLVAATLIDRSEDATDRGLAAAARLAALPDDAPTTAVERAAARLPKVPGTGRRASGPASTARLLAARRLAAVGSDRLAASLLEETIPRPDERLVAELVHRSITPPSSLPDGAEPGGHRWGRRDWVLAPAGWAVPKVAGTLDEGGVGATPKVPGTARLELLASRPAAGLELTLAPPPRGAAVLVRLDGSAVACAAVAPGSGSPGGLDRLVLLDLDLAPGPHLIEIETLGAAAGLAEPTFPHAVRLFPPS